jgi:PAS domain-containing protein
MFSFKTKLFLTFLIFGFLLVVSTLFITLDISQNSIKKTTLKNAKIQFYKNNRILHLYINNAKAKLLAIENSKIFKQSLNNSAFEDNTLKELFLNITQSDSFIMQLRYIDKNGDEVIRVNRNVSFSSPYLVKNTNLQNKKNRYYFKKIMSLYKDDFWVSNLDLNIEHSKIEKPLKPVIRVGTPIYKDGEKTGILIINMFLKDILNTISSTKVYNIYIIDKDGYFIIHPNPKYSWSRYLKTNVTVKDFFKDYKNILEKDEYQSKELYSAKIDINDEKLKMILKPTKELIKANEENIYSDIIYIIIILLALSIPVSFMLTKPYVKMKHKLDSINKNLEQKVEEKTKELIELNKILEQKIEERTQEENILLSLLDLGNSVLFKWRNDDVWSVEFVSESVMKLLGYSSKEFIDGKIKYADCIHHDDIKRVISEVENAINKKLYYFNHEPYRIITKDKKIKWIHDDTVIVRDDNGDIINFVGYLT